MNNKYISVKDGIAKWGLDYNASWIIDLEKGKEYIANTTHRKQENDDYFIWRDIICDGDCFFPDSNINFICDDDEGSLFFCANTNVEIADDIFTQEMLIDQGIVNVCIDLHYKMYYNKEAKDYFPIV